MSAVSEVLSQLEEEVGDVEVLDDNEASAKVEIGRAHV